MGEECLRGGETGRRRGGESPRRRGGVSPLRFIGDLRCGERDFRRSGGDSLRCTVPSFIASGAIFSLIGGSLLLGATTALGGGDTFVR